MAAVKLRLNFLPPFEMGALVVFPISALIAAASYRLIESRSSKCAWSTQSGSSKTPANRRGCKIIIRRTHQ
jgi:hypothetical protein